MTDLIYMIIQWVVILSIRLPLILVGFLVVPIALPFKYHHSETTRPFTKYDTDMNWQLVTLPKWAWLWSNDRDGALGDKRGWWNHNCKSGDAMDFASMFHWLAIRNPVNNMRFVRGISCNVSLCNVSVIAGEDQYVVDDKVGKTGFQWLKATGPKFNYYTLYWVRPNKSDPNKAFIIRMGHKIKVSHNDTDWSQEEDSKVWKGFTFRIGFNKDIS